MFTGVKLKLLPFSQMSSSLLTAMESEPHLGDLGGIANFMQRVNASLDDRGSH
jgi:hypothetical protein